jgi:hypothetical protein
VLAVFTENNTKITMRRSDVGRIRTSLVLLLVGLLVVARTICFCFSATLSFFAAWYMALWMFSQNISTKAGGTTSVVAEEPLPLLLEEEEARATKGGRLTLRGLSLRHKPPPPPLLLLLLPLLLLSGLPLEGDSENREEDIGEADAAAMVGDEEDVAGEAGWG